MKKKSQVDEIFRVQHVTVQFWGQLTGKANTSTGAIGLGPFRRGIRTNNTIDSPLHLPREGEETEFQFPPRNALSLWNRGVSEWDVMLWDGRLSGTSEEGFDSPAGPFLPGTFTNALAAFSIFHVTPDEEMRGFPEQADVFGNVNEIAGVTNDQFEEIWPLVTARIVDNPAYDELLDKALDKQQSDLTINDLSESIGTFMTETFTALNSPFDHFLTGNRNVLSDDEKRGAILFYSRANCVACHSGGLQTDLEFHNIASPHIGTGRGATAAQGLDFGRGAITGNSEENFKFSPPPSLRNIELEAPYFHNGAYTKLEDAVQHHLNPAKALAKYDDSQIDVEYIGTFQEKINDELLETISPYLAVRGRPLPDREVSRFWLSYHP